MMIEATLCSKELVLTRATRRNIPEDGIPNCSCFIEEECGCFMKRHEVVLSEKGNVIVL
jgi:hypothetical protein